MTSEERRLCDKFVRDAYCGLNMQLDYFEHYVQAESDWLDTWGVSTDKAKLMNKLHAKDLEHYGELLYGKSIERKEGEEAGICA